VAESTKFQQLQNMMSIEQGKHMIKTRLQLIEEIAFHLVNPSKNHQINWACKQKCRMMGKIISKASIMKLMIT